MPHQRKGPKFAMRSLLSSAQRVAPLTGCKSRGRSHLLGSAKRPAISNTGGCEEYEGAHEVPFVEASHRREEGDSLCRREGPAPPPILLQSPKNLHFPLKTVYSSRVKKPAGQMFTPVSSTTRCFQPSIPPGFEAGRAVEGWRGSWETTRWAGLSLVKAMTCSRACLRGSSMTGEDYFPYIPPSWSRVCCPPLPGLAWGGCLCFMLGACEVWWENSPGRYLSERIGRCFRVAPAHPPAILHAVPM
jgi:hypothetical protein